MALIQLPLSGLLIAISGYFASMATNEPEPIMKGVYTVIATAIATTSLYLVQKGIIYKK